MPNQHDSEPKIHGRQRVVIYVVEARQATGRWEPVAAPKERPFTIEAAQKRMKELMEEYPYLRVAHRRKMLRIKAYAIIREADEE